MGGIFRDKDNQVVLAQKPNAPIVIWAIATLLNIFTDNEFVSKLLSIVGNVAILTWAILELFTGVTLFRRMLGMVVIFAIFWNYLY